MNFPVAPRKTDVHMCRHTAQRDRKTLNYSPQSIQSTKQHNEPS